MKLFLASEAKNPVSFERLKEYVGGFEGKKLAYIPTAANGDGFGSWKSGGSWNLVQTLNADLKLVQLEDHRNDNVLDVLKDQDIIWFAGGYCGYLMYWIRRTQLDKYLPELLKTSIYVGSSAGSMITSKTLGVTDWYIGESEPGASLIPGLGLVDFEIYPHYEDNLYDEIKKRYKGDKLYLLKNGEAIIVEDDNIKVFGEERIFGN